MSVDCRTANSSYTPSELVSAFHNIPHIDVHTNEVSSEFSLTLNYFEPIIIWACIPILVCLCIFILLSVYFICVCCCCCFREKQQRSKGVRCSCVFVISLLIIFCLYTITTITIFGILCLCGYDTKNEVGVVSVPRGIIGATFYAEITLDQKAKSFLNEGQNVVSDIQDLNNSVNSYNPAELDGSITAIIQAISSSNGSNRSIALLSAQGLQRANNNISVSLNVVSGALFDLQYSNGIDTIYTYETIRTWTVIGFMIAIACVLLLVCLVSICMTPVGILIMLVILAICTVLVWIVAGGALGITIVISDICYDPDTVIRNFTTPDSTARDVVDYFISCEQYCRPFQQELNQSNEALNAYRNAQDIVHMYIRVNNLTNVTGDIEVVQSEYYVVRGIINNITSTIICSSSQGFHEYYLRSLFYLCNEGQMFVVILLSMIGGLAISFYILICCLTCFAGILINTSKEDEFNNDDIVAYDSAQTATWSSANNRRHSYTEPYSNGGHREEFMMSGLPPKYSDLSSTPVQRERRLSGEYDHFDV